VNTDEARKRTKLAHDRLASENSVNLERFRRVMYKIQSACEHDWDERHDRAWLGEPVTWMCSACGVVSDKTPTKGLT
jgi:hypothetical protein